MFEVLGRLFEDHGVKVVPDWLINVIYAWVMTKKRLLPIVKRCGKSPRNCEFPNIATATVRGNERIPAGPKAAISAMETVGIEDEQCAGRSDTIGALKPTVLVNFGLGKSTVDVAFLTVKEAMRAFHIGHKLILLSHVGEKQHYIEPLSPRIMMPLP